MTHEVTGLVQRISVNRQKKQYLVRFPTKELWARGAWGPARQLVDPFPSVEVLQTNAILLKKCLFLFIYLAALVSVEACRNLSASKMIFSFSL